MLYELSHFIKKHLGFVWEGIEWGNAEVFGLQHRAELRRIPALLEAHDGRFVVKSVEREDGPVLERFFSEQPEGAFEFFRPHDFDAKSLARLAGRKSFLMFIVKDEEEIVGYFFLRCFANGKAFKGRIVDYRRRNQGIAKLMGNVINDIVTLLGLRLYTTISPENFASLASTKAVNDVRIVRTLKNGYYYIECTPKSAPPDGRGNN